MRHAFAGAGFSAACEITMAAFKNNAGTFQHSPT